MPGMTEKYLREHALPRPFEMAAVVLAVLFYVLFLPADGGHDFAPRLLCLLMGAGSFAIYSDYRRRAREKAKQKPVP